MKEAATKIRAIINNELAGMVNVPGSYQAQAGCAADWAPDCEATAMTKGDDGLYTSGPFNIKAGEYEAKLHWMAHGRSTTAVDGKENGDDYKFSLAADGTVSFSYDPATNILTITTQ